MMRFRPLGSLTSQTVFGVCLISALVSCAAPALPPSQVVAPPADSVGQIPRKLPPAKGHIDLSGGDPYPEQAKRQSLTGRVLVEFQVNPSGKATSVRVLAADAAPVLRSGAVDFIKRMTFDVSGPGFDPADPTPFRTSVLFCLLSCGGLVAYPGTEPMTLTGSPLR
jgi:TonB family protein